jgi:hypothetical protein
VLKTGFISLRQKIVADPVLMGLLQQIADSGKPII